MKKFSLILSLVLLLCSFLQAISTDELYRKLSGSYSKLSSFQAEVKQDNYYAQIKKSISYQGKLYFTPGRMLMHFSRPNVQRLYISGGSVDLYDAQSKTVFRSTMRPEFGKMNPVEILQHYWLRSTVQITSTKGHLSTVKLSPAKDPMISQLTATVNNQTGLVSNLSYTDAGGNKVSYAFSSIKTNAGIPAAVWNYKYPKDVQVVSQ